MRHCKPCGGKYKIGAELDGFIGGPEELETTANVGSEAPEVLLDVLLKTLAGEDPK